MGRILMVGDKFKTNTSVPKDYNIEVTAIFTEHGDTYRAIQLSKVPKIPQLFVAYRFYQIEDSKEIHIMLMKSLGQFLELIKGLEPYKTPTILDKIDKSLEEFTSATARQPEHIILSDNNYIELEQTMRALGFGIFGSMQLVGYRNIPVKKVFSKESVILVG